MYPVTFRTAVKQVVTQDSDDLSFDLFFVRAIDSASRGTGEKVNEVNLVPHGGKIWRKYW